jgi:fermentation-respiration switch protein FrsA (DUF1100 family)
MPSRRTTWLLAALLALLGLAPAAAEAAVLKPFGRGCVDQHGVRFCPGSPVGSFDGVPLDVDVTLPRTGNGPFPTIAILHALGGNKRSYFATHPDALDRNGQRTVAYHYNTNFYARRGYAVISPSARGFAGSCGTADARQRPGCGAGWSHFADQRWEAHDTQRLLGLLVDQGIARPDRLGVTGVSYGAVQAMELALLRDRVRTVEGRYVRWTSPRGTPLRIAAAYARHGWHDPVDALLPNGRSFDWRPWSRRTSRSPLGVAQDRNTALLRDAARVGYLAPRGTDYSADVENWLDRLLAGDPFGREVAGYAGELTSFHGASGVDVDGRRPAPLLIESGWQDSIVPVRQGLSLYRRLRAEDKNAKVRLQVGDIGHAPAARTSYAGFALADRGAEFLDGWLVRGREPAGAAVIAYPLTCPDPHAPVRPFVAGDWNRLPRGAVVLRARGGRVRQPARSGPPAPPPARSEDASHVCESAGSARAPGVAFHAWRAGGVTLLGGPVVRARVSGRYAGGRLAAALYAVDRRRRAILLGSNVVRLGGSRELVFQFSPVGYRLARGSALAVVLAGSVPGSVSPSTRPVDMRVHELSLELPVRERPNGRSIVRRSSR